MNFQEDQEEMAITFAKARELYTQKELANLLDYNPKQISRWESGKSPVPVALLPALREITRKSKYSPKETGDFTFIDLFAGIGGIRLGFESVGGHCVFTSEWDGYAQKTYGTNFHDQHPVSGDITTTEVSNIPDHDVLLAGFPCQPFSIAGVSKKNSLGKPHGFECATQGTLFFDVARIIAAKRPKAFLLENVKNLLSHDKGRTFEVIMQTLEQELGYHISWKVLDGKHFVPQHRERIIIVGFSEKVDFNWNMNSLPVIGSESPKLNAILHPEDGTEIDIDNGKYLDKNGKVLDKYILSDRLWSYLQKYAARHKAKGNGFGCSVVKPEDTSRTLSARYYKDGSEILVCRGENNNPRRLTPRECARLMGFPDQFTIPVSDTRAYKQFGNSVVMPLMRHVARLMRPGIMELKSKHQCIEKDLLLHEEHA